MQTIVKETANPPVIQAFRFAISQNQSLGILQLDEKANVTLRSLVSSTLEKKPVWLFRSA